MDLVEKTYNLTTTFPIDEKFGLINQIRRYAVSMPSNIAEGAGRNSNKEFRNFLGIANGSINELATPLELSVRIGYIKEIDLLNISILILEIQKMNFALIQKFSNL